MSEWKRSTKEVSLESLPPEMAHAISRHIERYNLGPILAEALMLIQTDSEKTTKGLFGGSTRILMAAIITSRWLVWAVDESKGKSAVRSAQLIHVTVQDYAQTPYAKMVPDSGIEVGGMFTDSSESASAFLGLEENLAGQKFRDIVIKAAAAAKK
jgi:hypothetical protein